MSTDPTDLQPPHLDPVWAQVTVEFTDYATAEQIMSQRLLPTINDVATLWWFVRKAPHWRLRYLPEQPDRAADAHRAVTEVLNNLQSSERIRTWFDTIYEPETHAFGGTDGMAIAHRLFHHDSKYILTRPIGPDHRREHTILLCSVLLRAAGQDWYEQGDVWARVAENRPPRPQTADEPQPSFTAGLKRLMSVDASPNSPLLQPDGGLADLAEWTTAFQTAGNVLGGLARHGQLTRGLRAILAHHVIFHWNRLGLPYQTQSLLAATAREVVFG
ncbi:thiopeptide-type bacteriocin biosynthesis protein [Actinokineospora sp. NBRC 105648]|uniref:thiopeptide-type bacteriocin biosynthesis protein n=1 Tax=Actinokineospora sp. NBRC 105648 TaxID=3032206 RepID=UPI0024A4C79F|nr:thiopeptide-type bacteriocin biosynthesis protein [Actinokineospora sp. NBRC 105648]GLZ42838.1 hypothetical protein Acsp05_64620 [Actinokineospora sp. NBRC 105648]